MFEGIVIGVFVAAAVVGGKALLASMASLPIIGGFAGWYADFVGPLPDGIASNMIYGAMAMHVVLVPLGILLYGPRLVKRVNRLRRQPAA